MGNLVDVKEFETSGVNLPPQEEKPETKEQLTKRILESGSFLLINVETLECVAGADPTTMMFGLEAFLTMLRPSALTNLIAEIVSSTATHIQQQNTRPVESKVELVPAIVSDGAIQYPAEIVNVTSEQKAMEHLEKNI